MNMHFNISTQDLAKYAILPNWNKLKFLFRFLLNSYWSELWFDYLFLYQNWYFQRLHNKEDLVLATLLHIVLIKVGARSPSCFQWMLSHFLFICVTESLILDILAAREIHLLTVVEAGKSIIEGPIRLRDNAVGRQECTEDTGTSTHSSCLGNPLLWWLSYFCDHDLPHSVRTGPLQAVPMATTISTWVLKGDLVTTSVNSLYVCCCLGPTPHCNTAGTWMVKSRQSSYSQKI